MNSAALLTAVASLLTAVAGLLTFYYGYYLPSQPHPDEPSPPDSLAKPVANDTAYKFCVNELPGTVHYKEACRAMVYEQGDGVSVGDLSRICSLFKENPQPLGIRVACFDVMV